MKSRTSSFNLTVFKKDLTRFAPAWAAYSIILLLAFVGVLNENHSYYQLTYIEDSVSLMAWANLIYAPVVAQLLFGDLYNSRLCNALHALPVTRESWFATHTAAGLAFSLLPNLAICLITLAVLNLGGGWTAVPLWLGASTLQYLFYFGTAVLCIMLSGNRLGMLAMYAIIQFAGFLAYWLANALYEPLLNGILISEDPFSLLCPIMRMSMFYETMIIDYTRLEDGMGEFLGFLIYGVSPGEGWGYSAICAGVGILALAGALHLYRKRKLECAGDFVAFPALEPVVAVLVTIFAGGFFHLCGEAFGLNIQYVLLAAGMVVGYFACRMLLERSTRVFRKKAFLNCGAIMTVFALTLGLTYLDPVGITRYLPEPEEVESVTFSQSYNLSYHGDFPFVATEKADIEAILGVHEDGITKEASSQPGGTDEVYNTFEVRLEYKLKNGKTVNRFYSIYPGTRAGQTLKGYFTRPECVLGFPADRASEMTEYIRTVYVDGVGNEWIDPKNLDLKGMLDAIIADCQAGNMAKISGYHYPVNYDFLDEDFDMGLIYLEIGWDHEKMDTTVSSESLSYGSLSYSTLRVYESCTNTLKWLEDNGLLTDAVKQEIAYKYGGIYPEIVIPGKIG